MKNFKNFTTLKANPTPKVNMGRACTHEPLGGREKTSLENKVEKAPPAHKKHRKDYL